MESMRQQDMAAESVIAEYLDRYFYPTIMPLVQCSWSRAREKDLQLKGVDVQVMLPNGCIVNIDEKAQVDYLKDPLPTFVLELEFIDAKNGHRKGWFLDDGLSTGVYLFVWPRADVDKSCLAIEDIKFCECMMVPKAKIQLALEEEGWDAEALRNFEKLMRIQKHAEIGSKPLIEWDFISDWEHVEDVPGVKACRSSQLREDPINLVATKHFLSSLATGHYMVNSEKVKVLEKPDSLSGRSIPHSLGQDAT